MAPALPQCRAPVMVEPKEEEKEEEEGEKGEEVEVQEREGGYAQQ